MQRKRGLATSQASWPLRAPKKVSQESPLCPAGVPALCQKKNQLEKDADTTTGQTATQRNCSSPADCSRPRKRKFPLLPHRRGEPLRLPSPPELGFRVTTEDLDREKRAALQRIQDALRGDTEATCSCGPSLPSRALALSAVVAAPCQPLTSRSPAWTAPLLPSLSSWGLTLAAVGATLHLPRPSQCRPGAAWPQSQSPQGCLRCLGVVATRDTLPRPHSGLLVGSGPEPAPFTALPSMDSRQLRLQTHSRL